MNFYLFLILYGSYKTFNTLFNAYLQRGRKGSVALNVLASIIFPSPMVTVATLFRPRLARENSQQKGRDNGYVEGQTIIEKKGREDDMSLKRRQEESEAKEQNENKQINNNMKNELGYDVNYAKKMFSPYPCHLRQEEDGKQSVFYAINVLEMPDGKQIAFCPSCMEAVLYHRLVGMQGIDADNLVLDSPLNKSKYLNSVAAIRQTGTCVINDRTDEFNLWFNPQTGELATGEKVFGNEMARSSFEQLKNEARNSALRMKENIQEQIGYRDVRENMQYRTAASLFVQKDKIILECNGKPLARLIYDEKSGQISLQTTVEAHQMKVKTERGIESVAEVVNNASDVMEQVMMFDKVINCPDNIDRGGTNYVSFEPKGQKQDMEQAQKQGRGNSQSAGRNQNRNQSQSQEQGPGMQNFFNNFFGAN